MISKLGKRRAWRIRLVKWGAKQGDQRTERKDILYFWSLTLLMDKMNLNHYDKSIIFITFANVVVVCANGKTNTKVHIIILYI
jgi:hypothetical protein